MIMDEPKPDPDIFKSTKTTEYRDETENFFNIKSLELYAGLDRFLKFSIYDDNQFLIHDSEKNDNGYALNIDSAKQLRDFLNYALK